MGDVLFFRDYQKRVERMRDLNDPPCVIMILPIANERKLLPVPLKNIKTFKDGKKK